MTWCFWMHPTYVDTWDMQRSKSDFLNDLHDYLSGHTNKCRVTETTMCGYNNSEYNWQTRKKDNNLTLLYIYIQACINNTVFSSSNVTARQKWRITTQMWYVQFRKISFFFVLSCDFTHTTIVLIRYNFKPIINYPVKSRLSNTVPTWITVVLACYLGEDCEWEILQERWPRLRGSQNATLCLIVLYLRYG